MALETIRGHVAAHSVQSPVGTEIVKERTGSHRGERVKASLENSKASEAAKTVKPHALLKANMKTMHTRVMRQGQAGTADGASRIAEFLDKVPNFLRDEAMLTTLVESFERILDDADARAPVGEREGRRGADDEDGENAGSASARDGTPLERVFDELQRFDADGGRQRGALEFLREFFAGGDADPRLGELLKQADGVLQGAATLETDPKTVRESYRELLRNRYNVGAMFDKLAPFDLTKNFSTAIGVFVQAAGADLRATGPDTDKRFIEALLSELNNLHKMRTVLENSGRALRNVKPALTPAEHATLDPVKLTSQTLHFSGKAAVGFDDVKQLFGAALAFPPSGQVAFANELRGLLAECPDGLFASSDSRLKLNQVFTLFVDGIVAAEDAQFQSQMAS